MEIELTKKLKKNLPRFFCEFCDFKCYMKCDWDRHILRPKHIKNENGTNLETNLDKKTYFCNCGKKYTTKSGLWKHKKSCTEENSDTNITTPFELTKETILAILKQNSEFQQMLLEQSKTMMDLAKNSSITNNNTNNSHNKTFNLNLFLNETCKNAMNINDFVDSLQLQLSDLEKVGEVGYIEGISNIIIKNLNAMDVTLRPVHCTDKKRETMYIKDEDKWEKEDVNKVKLHKMVRKVANKNIHLIQDFKDKYPDCIKSTSRHSDKYNKIIVESMGGTGDNEHEKEEKIIKKVAKEVLIDKSL
jgi:dGTP triphosphohydrolase